MNKRTVLLPTTEELIRFARAGDTESASQLVRRIVTKLRTREQINPQEADHLADALEAALARPGDAAKALGLTKQRGAPRRGNFARLLAGRQVSKLLALGIPLKDGRATDIWNGTGAISRVAAKRKLTCDQVKRGYTVWKKLSASFGPDEGAQ